MLSTVACSNKQETSKEPTNSTTRPMSEDSMTSVPIESQPASTPESPTEEIEPPIEETEPPTTEPPEFSIKLSFVGDCMLASDHDKTTSGSFNEYANKKEPSYFLEKVRTIFEADDFTIVNLENVFTDNPLKEVEKDHSPAFWYKSKTSNVNILTSSSVEGVSLANNHIYDYGAQGCKDTQQTIKDAGLQYGFSSTIMYFEKNGFTIAVICSGLWGEWQANDIVHLINTAEEKSDYQVVFYHGGKERLHKPEEWKIRASRKLVDNGADLVIGNHPHVLQPREIYNGVEIMYSLGNFCYGGNRRPENRTVIYQMELIIDKETVQLVKSDSSIIPCYVYTESVNNYQPAPIEDQDEINKVLEFLDGLTDTPL